MKGLRSCWRFQVNKINYNFEAGTLEFWDKAAPPQKKWYMSSWLLSQNALQAILHPSILLKAELL